MSVREADNVPLLSGDLPVPLSFPAILRNPGLSDRYAHLQPRTKETLSSSAVKVPSKKRLRDGNEGKRWIRRKENGMSCQASGRPASVLYRYISHSTMTSQVFRKPAHHSSLQEGLHPFFTSYPSHIPSTSPNLPLPEYARPCPALTHA